MLGFADDEAGENLTIEAAKRRRREHTFRSAARAHNHVHARADNSGGNAGGEVAVTDKPDACPAARISSMSFSWRGDRER